MVRSVFQYFLLRKLCLKHFSPAAASACSCAWLRLAASSNHQPDGPDSKGRKRTFEELKATEAPEDEQHSSQSAFHQYRPQLQQNGTNPSQEAPSNAQAIQLLLDAAQSQEDVSRPNQQRTKKASFRSPANPYPGQPAKQPVTASTEQAAKTRLPASLSRLALLPPQQYSSQRIEQAPRRIDAMYACIKPASRIAGQLIWDIQRLEHPDMDADSVQAALEFAHAIQIQPAQHAQQLDHSTPCAYAPQRSAEEVTLMHTLEVATSRLDVLKILTHRVRSSSVTNTGVHEISDPSQLLDVIQDLLTDMEVSQQLLQHAEHAVLAYTQAAMSRVDSLKAHCRATHEYWAQSQRLQDISVQRRSELQKMLM